MLKIETDRKFKRRCSLFAFKLSDFIQNNSLERKSLRPWWEREWRVPPRSSFSVYSPIYNGEMILSLHMLWLQKVRGFLHNRHEKWSHSVVSDSLQPHGLYSVWNFPGQNTGVGSFSLLQGIVPTQGWNPGLPHCKCILYQLSHKGSSYFVILIAHPEWYWASRCNAKVCFVEVS